MRFEAQEPDEIVILANAELLRSPERSPQTMYECGVSCEVWVGANQILGDPGHKPLRVNIGERRNLLIGQFKHADAL